MEQNITLNSTLSEEDRILDVVQGACIPWGIRCIQYCAYSFKARIHNDNELFKIVHDIMEYFAKDRVLLLECGYKIEKWRKKPLFKDWIPPVFFEEGKVAEFKQYLINSNRKDLIWDDYMRYVSDVINILFIPTEVRDYQRDICILQEHFDWDLICKVGDVSFEDHYEDRSLKIFPHSKIVHQENDGKTIETYANSQDIFMAIFSGNIKDEFMIFPNPRYISYEQLLETIKPIIEKHGWKLGNTENPHKKPLQCEVNCLECDETKCPHYIKGKNPRVDQTYYRVDVD